MIMQQCCLKRAMDSAFQTFLGPGGTDIAVRLSAFILFCLGIQILWSGGSELLQSVIHPPPPAPTP
jgi:multiple antibiotic resistance protein